MIENYRDLIENDDADICPYKLAAEAQSELSDFCHLHWFELPSRVRGNYKDMWDQIYCYFYNENKDDFDHWRKVNQTIRSYLKELQTYHDMTAFDIAQREIISRLPMRASVWAYAILACEISSDDCYKISDGLSVSSTQLEEIEKRKLEYDKIRTKINFGAGIRKLKQQMNETELATNASPG